MTPILCQSCGGNPATIHFTEIKDDTKRELHICEACANQQGVGGGPTIPTMLANLVQGMRRAGDASALRCPACGITFDEFRARGRFGCPQDYEVFGDVLGPVLDKHHGARVHRGRLPAGATVEAASRAERLLELRRDLQRAVEGEEYERAAQIRDEIRRVEGDVGGQPVGEEKGRGVR